MTTTPEMPGTLTTELGGLSLFHWCCGRRMRRVYCRQWIERPCGQHAAQYRYFAGWQCECCGHRHYPAGGY